MDDRSPPPPTRATGLALLVALGGPPLFAVLPDRLFGESPGLGLLVLLQLLFCGLPALVIWVVLARERLPLSSIGLRRPDRWTLLFGALLWAVVVFALPRLTAPLLESLGPTGLQAGLERLSRLPLWFRVLAGLTGGAVEETLYRGYAVERLAALTGRRWLGGALSALAFGLAHVPRWGAGFALAADLPFGVLMTAFYLWRRDLLANILAHSGGLVVSMLTVVP